MNEPMVEAAIEPKPAIKEQTEAKELTSMQLFSIKLEEAKFFSHQVRSWLSQTLIATFQTSTLLGF